jgi:hypothetical protein
MRINSRDFTNDSPAFTDSLVLKLLCQEKSHFLSEHLQFAAARQTQEGSPKWTQGSSSRTVLVKHS